MTNWRYCNVKPGEKVPYPAGWQNTPKTLDNIDSTNVGVLLGPVSQGLVALDFDGTTAWSWYSNTIGAPLPKTIMWSSGKPDRCQMAFTVPEQYWPLLRTQKITNTTTDLITKGEGFEFRWTGGQSVLPPSRLTDGRAYMWLATPLDTDVAEIPEAILDYWVLLSNPEPKAVEVVYPPATESEVTELAEKLKSLYPTLDNYDTWIRVTWAFCNTIGYADGITLMRYYWPEQQAGEYAKLNSSPPERKCGIGTIKKLIRDRSGDVKNNKLSAVNQLAEQLRRKYL